MYVVKYGAMIGLQITVSCILLMGTLKKRVYRPITAPHLTMYIKPRNFAKRQCKLQWLTPTSLGSKFKVLESGVAV